jgi:hypothetical protein
MRIMQLVMNSGRLALVSIVLGVTLSGCETYLDAKKNVAPGGQLERDTADARRELDQAKRENVRLQQAKVDRERELERNERRIQAIEADLRQQDSALASALQAKKLTKTRHDQIKRDMEAIRKETAALGRQNDSDRLSGASDSKADAAKEARLRDLERRKKELEAALAALVKR